MAQSTGIVTLLFTGVAGSTERLDQLGDDAYEPPRRAHFRLPRAAVRNRTSMTNSTGTTTWTYDNLDRLTNVAYPNGDTVAYGYDTVGNRTSHTVNGVAKTNTFDDANRMTALRSGGRSSGPTVRESGRFLGLRPRQLQEDLFQ
jgi:YD repeat-containing protein